MFTHPGKVSKCRGAHVTRPRGRAGRNPPGTREHTAEPGGRLQLKVDNSTSRRRVGVRVWGVGAGCGCGVRDAPGRRARDTVPGHSGKC